MRLYWLATSGVLLLTPTPPYFTIDPSRYGGSTIPGTMTDQPPYRMPMPQLIYAPPTHPPVERARWHIDPVLPKNKAVTAELKRMNGLTKKKGESTHEDRHQRWPRRTLPGRQRIHR